MNTIWRIENKEGIGPYQGNIDSFELNEMMHSHNRDDTKPVVCEDKGIMRYPEQDEICGFEDMHQVKSWFTREELIALYKGGYNLRRIEVSVITAQSSSQLLAIKRG